MSFNLDKLSLKELKKLERDIAAVIDGFDARRKAAAILELEAHARRLGFSLAELTGATAIIKGKRAPAKAKYFNPADPTETWSGRGRKPAWFNAAIEQGATPTSLEV